MLRTSLAEPRTVVLIPACNEEERIGPVVRDVLRELPQAQVVVIDDGSGDRTGEVAKESGAAVLRHPFNLGYGVALQTGYHFAHRENADRVIQLDGDGQHVPASIPDLLAPLALSPTEEGADVVVGSRFLGTAPRTSRLRRLGSKAFAFLVTRWTGQRITDPTSGFQALNRRALDHLTLDHFPEDYPDADVLIHLSRSGLRLSEVPVVMRERLGGVSMHRGTRILFYAYKMALSLCLLRVRRASAFRSGRALARDRQSKLRSESTPNSQTNRRA
ncbi:MAG: glycosyltransferase family 2 protein [Planctomycetota bacterium]